MTPLELIQRLWVERTDRHYFEPGSVGVELADDGYDVLWLHVPESDPALTSGCKTNPQLADLILLSREQVVRQGVTPHPSIALSKREVTKQAQGGEAIVRAPRPWRVIVVELKKGGHNEATARSAAQQIANLASLAFAADWPDELELCGLVVYAPRKSAPPNFSALKQQFREKYGIPLRFEKTDSKYWAQVAPSKVDVAHGPFTKLQQHRVTL